MRKPDIRQRIIEQVLTMAAEAGVDDVELIAANALHRRMTAAELKHIVGERVFRSFHPQGLLTNHDAEDHDNLLHVGTDRPAARTSRSTGGPPSPTCWSTSTSTWWRWTAGTSRSPIGLASYKRLRHHHNAQTMVRSHSFMDHKAVHLHHSAWRMGRLLKDHSRSSRSRRRSTTTCSPRRTTS